MKKEEIISSVIMFIVCGLVLVGFTIAWFTASGYAFVTGLQVVASEMASVKVSLSEGGVDIAELIDGEVQYADFGMPQFVNLDENDLGELGPGCYGEETFYVTPKLDSIAFCDIVPTLLITQDGSTWYPDMDIDEESAPENESDTDESSGEEGDEDTTSEETESGIVLENLYAIAQSHIRFYSDPERTNEITMANPLRLEWPDDAEMSKSAIELPVTIYWRWDYEYPFTQEELDTLTDAEKKDKILQYDLKDIELGNNISGIKFHFTFTAQ